MRGLLLFITFFICLSILIMLVDAEDELFSLDRQIQHAKIMQGKDKPICIFGGGVGARSNYDTIISGESLYDGPVIVIPAYKGNLITDNLISDICRVVTDYLNPSKGKETGKRLLENLRKVYKECGRIDMATFHSASVVALNNVSKELDDLLSSGKLHFGKIALAGAHVQPELAEVLYRNCEKGNIKDWIVLERTYEPNKQRGDFVVFITTPNNEFENPLLAGTEKGLMAIDLICLFGITNGKLGVTSMYYSWNPEHFMETYASSVRQFFGISKKHEKQTKQLELKNNEEIIKTSEYEKKYPFGWPPDRNLAFAGVDPGGVFFKTGNTYLIDQTGLVREIEKIALQSKQDKKSISWEFKYKGKDYKAVSIPLKKKDAAIDMQLQCHYDETQNILVFLDHSQALALKVVRDGSYMQVMEMAEGEIINNSDTPSTFQITKTIFP